MPTQGGAYKGKRIKPLSNREEIWAKLPPALRALHRETAFDYAINATVNLLKKNHSVDEIIHYVKTFDAYAVARNCLADYGPSHPQANLELIAKFEMLTLSNRQPKPKKRKPTEAELEDILNSISPT